MEIWMIVILLTANIEPMMTLDPYNTKKECTDHIKELSEIIDKDVKILAPYPKYKCISVDTKNKQK